MPLLRQEFVTTERFERNMNAIGDSFNRVQDSIDRIEMTITEIQITSQLILKQIDIIIQDNKEYKKRWEQLYSTSIRHEREIDGLDQRVLKLETA